MFNSFARRLSRRLGNVLKFLSSEEEDDTLFDAEKNLYKRDISRAAKNFELFDEDLISPATLAKAIEKIGYLAYTGGPPANKCAGAFIPKYAELLNRAGLRADLKLAILKSLGNITINHSDHQNECFTEGLLLLVGDIIVKSDDALQLWAVYCLYCLVLDNVRSLQVIKKDTVIHESIRNASQSKWTGFSRNYANILLKLTGLEPVKVTKKNLSAPTSESNSLRPSMESPLKAEKKLSGGTVLDKTAKNTLPRSKLLIITEVKE